MNSKLLISPILQNHINNLSSNKMIGLVTRIHLGTEDIKKMYKEAHDNKLINRVEELCLSHVIKPEFNFLGSLYFQLIEEKKFNLIPPPAFSPSSSDFSDIVKDMHQDGSLEELLIREEIIKK